MCESLESDRKTFEDLEFQYFEEESEHHANHEEFKRHEQRLTLEAELAALRIQIGPNEDGDEEQEEQQDPTPPPSPESSSSGRNLVNGGVMSQSLFGSAELLCPKLCNPEDLMSRSVNENMFYNHKIEATTTSTPKRLPLQLFENIGGSCEQISFNLSLQSDRFEVNPLERRVPSQDDIDRSCKVANDAPISTSQGASTKIFDSIKEIERNRKLLLAQQGKSRSLQIRFQVQMIIVAYSPFYRTPGHRARAPEDVRPEEEEPRRGPHPVLALHAAIDGEAAAAAGRNGRQVS